MQTPNFTSSAPRSPADLSLFSALRGSSGHSLGMGNDWGLNPAAVKEFQNKNFDSSALQRILKWDGWNSLQLINNITFYVSRSKSLYVRFLLKDQLFLRHLQLFLQQPNPSHFHQLKNRAKTLRRRRTDQVSTRFFLRD